MKIKSVIAFILAAAMSLCLVGCGANPPSEEPTPETASLDVINPCGESFTEKDNDLVQYKSSVSNVQFEYQSYYKYENNYASISNINVDDESFTVNANGYVDFNIICIKNRSKNMKIGYTAYDADGDVVRKTYMMAKLDDVKEGETVKTIRFDFPYNAVKVVFHDYIETE